MEKQNKATVKKDLVGWVVIFPIGSPRFGNPLGGLKEAHAVHIASQFNKYGITLNK